MATQIYIVEDHPMMRKVLREAVERMPGLAVCGVAASAEEALEGLAGVEPDVVLVDMALPQMSGAELIAALGERQPKLRCLILSGHKEANYVWQALAAGARGYVLKGDPYEMVEAIETVLAGKTYLSEPLRMLVGSERQDGNSDANNL